MSANLTRVAAGSLALLFGLNPLALPGPLVIPAHDARCQAGQDAAREWQAETDTGADAGVDARAHQRPTPVPLRGQRRARPLR